MLKMTWQRESSLRIFSRLKPPRLWYSWILRLPQISYRVSSLNGAAKSTESLKPGFSLVTWLTEREIKLLMISVKADLRLWFARMYLQEESTSLRSTLWSITTSLRSQLRNSWWLTLLTTFTESVALAGFRLMESLLLSALVRVRIQRQSSLWLKILSKHGTQRWLLSATLTSLLNSSTKWDLHLGHRKFNSCEL